MTTTDPGAQETDAGPHWLRWIALVAVVLVLVLGTVVATLVLSKDETPTTGADVSQVRASCSSWMESSSTDAPSDNQWCTDMFEWMGNQSDGSMMDNMMWQGSSEIGKACREWAADERADIGTAGPQGCASMVEWMNTDMSSQDGRWMMRNR